MWLWFKPVKSVKLVKEEKIMECAARLNKIIETVCPKFPHAGYTTFENKTQLDALKSTNVHFTTSVPGMNAISHQIEEEAASFGMPFRFYSAFQKFSRVRPQARRYVRILQTHNPLFLFGVPDVVLWKAPNLIEVTLDEPLVPGYPYLANNWFVVLYNPDFTSMALVSREVDGFFGAPLPIHKREFEGFWTYDQAVISQVVELLDEYIEERVDATQPLVASF